MNTLLLHRPSDTSRTADFVYKWHFVSLTTAKSRQIDDVKEPKWQKERILQYKQDPFVARRKELESLTFGSVDQRSIQLS